MQLSDMQLTGFVSSKTLNVLKIGTNLAFLQNSLKAVVRSSSVRRTEGMGLTNLLKASLSGNTLANSPLKRFY